MMPPDRRTTLARPDLADQRLEGLVRADRFAETRAMTCAIAAAAIRKAPTDGSMMEDQLLLGEAFDVLEEQGGWAWGQARRDGYIGFVAVQALAPGAAAPTHWVRALGTPGFSEPDLKSPLVGLLSMNALVTAGEVRGRFVHTSGAGWVFEGHLAPIGAFETDPVAVAERFLGTPYLWGGRDRLGLDCSGLVQQSLYACGRACPRDTDQQMLAFPAEVDPAATARGDLVFWPGHVAIMIDATHILHANAHHMAVAMEPLAEAVERIRTAGVGEPPAYRRL